jgi:DhnA family fructose-bisphosphate aldolase class Ia
VEEAVALGADAVITYLFMGGKDPEEESQTVGITGEIAVEARRWGIVHVVEAMGIFGGIVDRDDPEVVGFCSRIAGEMGADVIKTNWTGSAESFAPVARQSLAPVVVAGGPRLDGDDAVAAYADAVVRSGAKGVMFGRNVFQPTDPPRLRKRLCARIHAT